MLLQGTNQPATQSLKQPTLKFMLHDVTPTALHRVRAHLQLAPGECQARRWHLRAARRARKHVRLPQLLGCRWCALCRARCTLAARARRCAGAGSAAAAPGWRRLLPDALLLQLQRGHGPILAVQLRLARRQLLLLPLPPGRKAGAAWGTGGRRGGHRAGGTPEMRALHASGMPAGQQQRQACPSSTHRGHTGRQAWAYGRRRPGVLAAQHAGGGAALSTHKWKQW